MIDVITNSSSSVFIVGFKEIPQTVGQLLDMMFPNGKRFVVAYDDALPVSEVVDVVFEDLKTASKITTKEEFIEEVSSGYFPGHPMDSYSEDYKELRDFEKKFYEKYGKEAKFDAYPDEDKKRWELIDAAREEMDKKINGAALKFADQEWEKLKDLNLFVFCYGDDNGATESILEHGDTFRNLPHICISHH